MVFRHAEEYQNDDGIQNGRNGNPFNEDRQQRERIMQHDPFLHHE